MITCIDMNRLREVTEGDAQLERQLYSLFLETADRIMSVLPGLIHDQSGGWGRAVHELKGASANMHIASMLELCRQMEKLDDKVLRSEKLGLLGKAYDKVRGELAAAIQLPQ